jgi:hypothetical protein
VTTREENYREREREKNVYVVVRTPTFNNTQLYESSCNFHFFPNYKLANGIVKYMFSTVGNFSGFLK